MWPMAPGKSVPISIKSYLIYGKPLALHLRPMHKQSIFCFFAIAQSNKYAYAEMGR